MFNYNILYYKGRFNIIDTLLKYANNIKFNSSIENIYNYLNIL